MGSTQIKEFQLRIKEIGNPEITTLPTTLFQRGTSSPFTFLLQTDSLSDTEIGPSRTRTTHPYPQILTDR